MSGLRVEFPHRRGTLVALDDVSFAIQPGEILGVVGESGAGKPLAGAAIIGLLAPPGHVAAGEIRVAVERIDHLLPEAMRRVRGKTIGSVFQDPLTSLNPLLTVGAQLVETIRTHLPVGAREARARALRLLREVGIAAPEARIDQYPHQFSGGMRQRVVIALALCAEPSLVIADEPTSALDVSVQAQVLNPMVDLQREFGLTDLFISHNLAVIRHVATRVAVMYLGRIVEEAAAEDLFARPRHPYTRSLLDTVPDLEDPARVRAPVIGEVPSPLDPPPGCTFHPRCPGAADPCRSGTVPLTRTGDRAARCHFPLDEAA